MPADARIMFYVLIREDDGSRFRTADLDQGLIVSGGVETHRDIFGFLGVQEEYAPEKNLVRVEKELAFQIGASVDRLRRFPAAAAIRCCVGR